MSDSKKDPKLPPPDDFSKTTPNISFEEEEDSGWGNTPSGSPSETPADDWGKTVINYNVAEEHDDSKGRNEPAPGTPREPEWGMTQPNININDEFESGEPEADDNYGKTTPYFRLPEVDREKYQNLPPTPTQKASDEASQKKGGIPGWFWAAAGIMFMLSFAFVVFLGVYYFFFYNRGFEVTIDGATPNSRFKVDGTSWGIESEKGNYRLVGLNSGIRTIEIVNPNSTCKPNPFQMEGKDGESLNKIVSCTVNVSMDCENTRDINERAKCADSALDALGDPPDLDALIKALNMLIINFESGKADIPAARLETLRKASVKIKQLPQTVVIEIGGHTDDVGSDSNNLDLSNRRAAAVKKVLMDYGVRDGALTAKGYGEAQPKADNKTEQGRFDNRRIQYTAVAR